MADLLREKLKTSDDKVVNNSLSLFLSLISSVFSESEEKSKRQQLLLGLPPAASAQHWLFSFCSSVSFMRQVLKWCSMFFTGRDGCRLWITAYRVSSLYSSGGCRYLKKVTRTSLVCTQSSTVGGRVCQVSVQIHPKKNKLLASSSRLHLFIFPAVQRVSTPVLNTPMDKGIYFITMFFLTLEKPTYPLSYFNIYQVEPCLF